MAGSRKMSLLNDLLRLSVADEKNLTRKVTSKNQYKSIHWLSKDDLLCHGRGLCSDPYAIYWRLS